MANLPNNILRNVQLYLRSYLALLQNYSCHVGTFNKRFNNFDTFPGNLGSSTTYDLPPVFTSAVGLVAADQPAVQRVATLTVNQANNVSIVMSAQEIIFNMKNGVEDYRKVFAKSGIAQLAQIIEGNVAQNWVSNVVDQTSGVADSTSGPARFYGNGTTAISSQQQLADMVMLFRTSGMAPESLDIYLPDYIIPSIVGTMANQFAPMRNEDILQSWMIGEFGTPADNYYRSNLLPIHTSGNTGVLGQTLTVVSTNDPTGQNVTQITVSGATASDANAIFAGDLFQFVDGVSGQPNQRLLTTIGQFVSRAPYQIRAAANAAADGSGNVVITLPSNLPIVWAAGANQNISNPVVAGMQLLGLPSHRAGGVVGGQAAYLAMPKLPPETPFDSVTETDPDTGASLRMSYGSLLGLNQSKMILYEIHGSRVEPTYSSRIVVPLTQ